MITLYDAACTLFPEVALEDVMARVCDVLWVQHGGSGMNITWDEAWALEWDELVDLIEEINRRRREETAALKRAHSGGGSRR